MPIKEICLGNLPWKFGKFSSDRNWYMNKTRGKTLVMGRCTWESMTIGWQRANYTRCKVIASADAELTFEDSTPVGDPSSFEVEHFIRKIDPMSYDHLIDLERNTDLSGHMVIGGWKLISSLIQDRAITVFNFTRINEVFLSDQRIDPDHESSMYAVKRQYEYDTNGMKFAEQYLK